MPKLRAKLLRPAARLAALPLLLAGLAGVGLAAVPSTASAAVTASAAPLGTQDGWVRIAHLSPQAPAMDMYLYPFGDPARPTVLKDVAYGDVSAYVALGPGQYTVAMRGFDAPASSKPALVSSFMVAAKTAYTAVALGPDPGLRVEVLKDQLATPPGKSLVRVLQASLKQDRVAVSYGSADLSKQLAFSSVTPYTAVSPGSHPVTITAPGQRATMPLTLTPGTVHTIVVLDGSSGLKADDVTDAVGVRALPSGGAGTGFGGTAPRADSSLTPWLAAVLAGAVLLVAGSVAARRRRPARLLPAFPRYQPRRVAVAGSLARHAGGRGRLVDDPVEYRRDDRAGQRGDDEQSHLAQRGAAGDEGRAEAPGRVDRVPVKWKPNMSDATPAPNNTSTPVPSAEG